MGAIQFKGFSFTKMCSECTFWDAFHDTNERLLLQDTISSQDEIDDESKTLYEVEDHEEKKSYKTSECPFSSSLKEPLNGVKGEKKVAAAGVSSSVSFPHSSKTTAPVPLQSNSLLSQSMGEVQNGSPRHGAILLRKRVPSSSRLKKNLFHSSTSDLISRSSSYQWTDVVETIKEDPKGAYLVCQPQNDGSWFIHWSQHYVEDAWLFSRPHKDSSIPLYKFQNATKEEICRGIHLKRDDACLGFINFLKALRKYKASLYVLRNFEMKHVENPDLFEIVSLGFFDAKSLEIHLPTERPDKHIADLSIYDAAVVVYGTEGVIQLRDLALQEGSNISLSSFLFLGNNYGASMNFV